jgi:hypothetical protein
MKEVKVTEAAALKAHREASKEGKSLLENLYGISLFNQKITNRVKTFEDALNIVGASDAVKSLCEYDGDDLDMIASSAHAKLTIVAKALNEGWKPDWKNSNEWKYVPWFYMDKPGSGFSYFDYGRWCATSFVGSRLCFKTRELAEYAGKQFLDTYKELMCI